MARYIDAVELVKAIEENKRNTEHHKDGYAKQIHVNEHRHFIKMVYEQPTADVAPKSECERCGEKTRKTIESLQKIIAKERTEVEELIYKLECLLCHATGSRLSKHTYDLRTMETAVTDYIDYSYEDGYKDGASEVAREIIEIARSGAEKYINDVTLNEGIRNMLSIMLDDFVAELKKKYTGEQT